MDDSSRSGWAGYLQFGVIAVVVVGALYLARAPGPVDLISGSALQASEGRPEVTVFAPEITSRALPVELTGNVRAQRRTTIISPVVGRVAWISPDYRNGGSVRAGEPFIRIDPAAYELKVRIAQAELDKARAILDETRSDREEGAAPASLQAEVDKRAAELELAELELAQTEISLPFDARVIATDVSVGELVGPNETVGKNAELGRTYEIGNLQIRAPLRQKELAYLAPVIGRDAVVRTLSGTHAARVAAVSAVIARESRLAAVILELDDTVGAPPIPGSFAQVSISGPPVGDVFVMPEAVLGGENRVWTVRDGALVPVDVDVLALTSEGAIVRSFDAGEGVVLNAPASAWNGMTVSAVSR